MTSPKVYEFSLDKRISFVYEDETHHISFVNFVEDKALILLQSETQMILLSLNEEKEIDLDKDGLNDISIKLTYMNTKQKRIKLLITPLRYGQDSSVLEIQPDKIIIPLKKGEVTNESILLKNKDNSDMKVRIKVSNLNAFVILNEKEFDLKAGESKYMDLEIIVRESVIPDSYLGRIIISTEKVEKEIFLVLDVSSDKPLLDVKSEILNKDSSLNPGDKLNTKIELFNLGQLPRVDVKVEYTLKNFLGETIIFEEETIAVETHTSYIKEFDIPSFVKTGTYTFGVKSIYYDGKSDIIATSSAWVYVGGPYSKYKEIIIILLILFFLFLVFKLRNKIWKSRRY